MAPSEVGVTTAPRLRAIDALRGLALLGILQMNLQLFAMPMIGYMRPTVLGPLAGLDLAAWLFTHLVCEFKFISVFSMLFGAGLALADRDGRAFAARQAALLVIGLAHAYLVWFGDILVTYSVAGLVAWRWRSAPTATQVRAGLALFLVPVVLLPAFEFGVAAISPELQHLAQEGFVPTAAALAREAEVYRGGWWGQVLYRLHQTSSGELFSLMLHLWRAAGCMVLGMALVRSGTFAGERPDVERALVRWGLAFGVPLMGGSAALLLATDFPPGAAMTYGLPSYVGSLPLALALVGGVLWWLRSRAAPALAAAGRLALTHYLGQSLLAAFLFYGFGLGWYGQVPRWGLVPLGLAIWGGQVAVSPVLERTLGRGPAERLWRAMASGARRFAR